MNIIDEVTNRGLVQNTSAPLDKIFSEKRTVYIGSDPTADSLHVGHLAWIVLMKRLGLAGNKLIILVGGGTGMIGDPKAKGERPLLTEEMVKANTEALKKQLTQMLGDTPFTMVDNAAWLNSTQLIPFLRDVGKYFTVNDLIKRDVIRNRLDNPDDSISYTEFTYSLLQGYDYFVLNEKYNCDLQIGGSDQWTNLLSGVDLIHKRAQKEAFALTMPLVTDSTGKKFGKSEGNAVWLDGKKTSPFAFYQFWLNQPDADIEKYLKVYTFLSLEEIAQIMKEHNARPELRNAQKVLAQKVTEMVHGANATDEVLVTTQVLFGDLALTDLDSEKYKIVLAQAPLVSITKEELATPITIIEAVVKAGLAPSKSEARRLIQGKGVFVNDVAVVDVAATLSQEDFTENIAFLRRGRQIAVLSIA